MPVSHIVLFLAFVWFLDRIRILFFCPFSCLISLLKSFQILKLVSAGKIFFRWEVVGPQELAQAEAKSLKTSE
jgi:hypothetical protein